MSAFKRIDQETAYKMMKEEKDYLIVDVRWDFEYAEGHIKNAINCPMDKVVEELSKYTNDKNKMLFVYCRSGNRSVTSSKTLEAAGYTNIYEFGGIQTWPYEIER